MGFLSALWNGLTGFLGLILPVGSGVRPAWMTPGVRWALHVLVLALVLLGLFLLNKVLGIAALIPGRLRVLAEFWLPILFLLVYTLAWVGWWLWQLLWAEETSYYPDIDEAWDEAMRT